VTELARSLRETAPVGARSTSASEEKSVTELARSPRETAPVGARSTSASEEKA
jgi:hypothetical protein